VLDLMQNVIDLNLQQGIENGLVAKLEAAMQSLDDINANNDVAAVNPWRPSSMPSRLSVAPRLRKPMPTL